MEEIKVNKKSVKQTRLDKYNMLIETLANEYRKAREREDYVAEDNIERKANNIKMAFTTLIQIEPINLLYYVNLNSKVMTRRNLNEATSIMSRLMKININSHNVKEELVTFISWSSGFNYGDKQIYKLVKKLCDYSTLNDTNLLLNLVSSLEAASCFESAAYVQNTRKSLKEACKLKKQEKTTTL